MKDTFQVYEYIKKEIKSNLVVPSFLTLVNKACQKALDTKFPVLISGQQAVGKTFGVQHFAYKKKMNITLLNASVVLRKKEGHLLVRAELLKPSRKLKFLVLDEVEKDTSIAFLSEMVKLNRKISHKTNVILICITNHYWQLGVLKTAFGAFHEEIKAPLVRSLGKALRDRGIKYSGPMIRDLRFFRSVLLKPNDAHDPSMPENTFEAIANFLSATIKDRDAKSTIGNMNAPLWRWLLKNFHHSTFLYMVDRPDGQQPKASYPSHNSAMFHLVNEGLSLANQYDSTDLLDFILPGEMKNSYTLHPAQLVKRNR